MSPVPAVTERLEDRTLLAAYVVDTLADEDDGNYAAGDLSLREAVGVAEAGGTVTFAASLAGKTITLGGSQIVLDRNVTLAGLGATLLTVSGNDASRIFQVSAGVTVAINGLALSRGRTNGAGGAILNFGTLTLSGCAVRSNFAGDVGGGVCNTQAASLAVETTDFSLNHGGWGGGAIFNSGDYSRYLGDGTFERFEASRVSLSRVTIAANTGRIGGGVVNHGVFAAADSAVSGNTANRDGGGIYNAGDLAITGGEVSDNAANGVDYGTDFGGGGIFNWGRVTLTGTTVAGNQARLMGGGLFGDGGTGVSIVASTFSDNFAGNSGGGICVVSGPLTVANSTISGNATAGGGGGILSDSATLRNSTVFGNRADADGDTYGDGGGLYSIGVAQILYNTLVAGNISGIAQGVPEDAYVYGGLALVGAHNLIGDAASAGGLIHGSNGNIVGVDWRTVVDPVLRDNGGPTETHVLLPGSLAVNAGSNAEAVAPDGAPFAYDQRGAGFARVVRGTVDVGAFERRNAAPVPKGDGVSTTEDRAVTGSLFADNGNAADGDPDGDPISVVAVNGVAASVGVTAVLPSGALLRVNADGTFSYDPNGKFEWLDGYDLVAPERAVQRFSYTVADPFGGTATADVIFVVRGINDPPVIRTPRVETETGVRAYGRLTATDVDNSVYYYGLDADPSHGTAVVQNDGSFTYTPNAGFVGVDSFGVHVNDSGGGRSRATVTVTVLPENRPPVTGDDVARVREDGTVVVNVLANDTDPEGKSIYIPIPAGPPQWLTLPSGARLMREVDGDFTYDPNGAYDRLRPGETAMDVVPFFVWDAAGRFANGVLRVTIYGRGEADLVGYSGGEWWATSSAGRATGRRAAWADAPWDALRQGDVDGDGATDIVGLLDGAWYVGRAAAAGFLTSGGPVWGNADWRDVAVRDVNGDGRDDLIGRAAGEWWVSLATSSPTVGQGFTAATRWAVWADAAWGFVSFDDLNGDGRKDLLGYLGGEWWAALSTGTTFWTASRWATWVDAEWDAVGTFDPDANGLADLFGLIDGVWYVEHSTGGSFYRTLRERWAPVDWRDVRAGDFDGDGFEDLAGRYAGRWYVSYSGMDPVPRTRLYGAWREADWRDVRVGDFDGDGRDDLIGRLAGQWWLSQSTGGLSVNRLWATWADTAWKAIAATELDGAIRPVSVATPNSMFAAIRPTPPAAFTAPTEDEPLLRFWSAAAKDDELAAGLLGAR